MAKQFPRKRRILQPPCFEALESRYLLNGDLASLNGDAFDVHQNGPREPLDVLANDWFDPEYEGERRLTSISYGSEGGTVELAQDGQSILYAPPADFFGTETFVYFVDGVYQAQVEIFVNAPLAFDTFNIPPDGVSRTLKVMANDLFWTDYDGQRQITAVSVTSAGGTVAIDHDRQTIVYTPPEGSFGNDQFVYIVDEMYPARVTITLPKPLEPDRFEIVANTQNHVLSVLSNDRFWPNYKGPGLITHITNSNTSASVEISGNGQSVIYSPAVGESGWDSFNYVVDSLYETTVNVRIHRPVRDDSFQIDQNSTNHFFNLVSNDTYRSLSGTTHVAIDRVTSVDEPQSGGTATVSAGGQGVRYTPPQGFSGTDTFTYLADGRHEAQVTVQVTRPVRDDYIFQGVYQDSPNAKLDVLQNDFLGNGYTGRRRITAVGPTESGGKVTIAPRGQSILYTPTPGTVGADRFTYTVDGQLDAHVTVTIQALAQNDYLIFCADPTTAFYGLTVLENDHFDLGYRGPGIITAVSDVTNGADVAIVGGQYLRYTPGPSGSNRFGYTVDGQYEATVNVSMTGQLSNDQYVVDQNRESSDLEVLKNDFSFDNRRTCQSSNYSGLRRITNASPSQEGGTVTVSANGRTVHYQPPTDFRGPDSFTYTVDELMQATVQVQVIRHVRDDQFRVDSSGGSQSLPVLVNDLFAADYTGAQRVTAVTATRAGATATVSDNGRSIQYTPPTGFAGTDTFTYTVDDALKAEVTVVIDLTRDEQFPQFGNLADYQQFLIDDALVRYDHLFGKPAWGGCLGLDEVASVRAAASCVEFDTAESGLALRNVKRSHSETNVQVEGVDEGDIIEFDSDYIYMLTDEELVIVNAWPADELSVAARIDIEGTPTVAFLHENRLTTISQIGHELFPWDLRYSFPPIPQIPSSTIVTVLDVTDRTAPEIVQTTTMEGRYVESRAIGDYVYVLVRNDNAVAPSPLIKTPDDPMPAAETASAMGEGSVSPTDDVILPPWPGNGVYETREEYLERITANPGQLVDEALPNFTSYGPDGKLVMTGLLNEPEGIFRPLLPEASTLMSIASFRITADAPGLASTAGVYGSGGSTVYASLHNFYVFDQDYSPEDGTLTQILKFDWNGDSGDVDFTATTTVPGSILNQFSADEKDGDLRIATTILNQWSGNWSRRADNTLFVLQEDNGIFEFVGSLQRIALDETIRSVRYIGDRAFVTTFQNIDPLFGLDLSDRENPRSTGHLTLPGFSSYMQMIDDNHLLAVGRNTPTGGQGPTQISLFDVSNLSQPRRLDEYTFARFSTSESETDHHAFGYFAEHGLLAIPTSRGFIQRVDTDGDGYRETAEWIQQEQLAVMAIDVTGTGRWGPGIQPVGEIPHDTQVRRSGYIGDKLYSIAVDSVKAVDVANPETVIGEVIVLNSDDPPGDDEEVVINYPAIASDSSLALAIQNAQAELADRAQINAGASILVVAASTAKDGGSQMVLRVADDLYLYETGDDGSVFMADDDYAFDVGSVWHAIASPDLAGDMNNNGLVENTDITVFIHALRAYGDKEAFLALSPDGNYQAADLTGDNQVNNLDISPFITLLAKTAESHSRASKSGGGAAEVASILAAARTDATSSATSQPRTASGSGHHPRSTVAKWLELYLHQDTPMGHLATPVQDGRLR